MREEYIVYKNVFLGKGVKIEPFCFVGKPPKNKNEGELELAIGEEGLIRAHSTIYAGSRMGNFLMTGTSVVIREDNIIGNNVSIGTSTVLEVGNRIGNNVRIHSSCFFEMTEIADDVFIGPCVVASDDPHPPCPRFRDCVGGPRIGKGVSIGANSTLLPGIKIGEFSLIGAGSVVTKDIPPGVVAAGNPAKIIKNITEIKCRKAFFKNPYEWRKKK